MEVTEIQDRRNSQQLLSCMTRMHSSTGPGCLFIYCVWWRSVWIRNRQKLYLFALDTQLVLPTVCYIYITLPYSASTVMASAWACSSSPNKIMPQCACANEGIGSLAVCWSVCLSVCYRYICSPDEIQVLVYSSISYFLGFKFARFLR